MKKRIVRILVLLVALAAAVAAYLILTRTPSTIVLTGIVTTDDVIVSAQIAGRLEALKVDAGSAVKKGDLLAVIQPGQWQADMAFAQSGRQQAATQVSEAQADLRFQESQTASQIKQAQANLAMAQAQVTQAQADLENAQITFDREEKLFHAGAETQQTFDLARTAREAQTARVEAARKQAEAADAAVAVMQANLEQVAMRRAAAEASEHQLAAMAAQEDKARVQLAYTQIVAPIGGVVDVRAARQGEVVNPGQAIVTLINPDDLWVRVDVEETYIERIKLGDKLTVRLPSGAELEGMGTVFYRAADADYATQRDVSRTKRDIRTFEIRLRCDNADRKLAVGMTAFVVLPVGP
jgi:HlyD family secretion protein